MLLNTFKQRVNLFLVWLGSHVIIVIVSYNHEAGAHNGNGLLPRSPTLTCSSGCSEFLSRQHRDVS